MSHTCSHYSSTARKQPFQKLNENSSGIRHKLGQLGLLILQINIASLYVINKEISTPIFVFLYNGV